MGVDQIIMILLRCHAQQVFRTALCTPKTDVALVIPIGVDICADNGVVSVVNLATKNKN